MIQSKVYPPLVHQLKLRVQRVLGAAEHFSLRQPLHGQIVTVTSRDASGVSFYLGSGKGMSGLWHECASKVEHVWDNDEDPSFTLEGFLAEASKHRKRPASQPPGELFFPQSQQCRHDLCLYVVCGVGAAFMSQPSAPPADARRSWGTSNTTPPPPQAAQPPAPMRHPGPDTTRHAGPAPPTAPIAPPRRMYGNEPMETSWNRSLYGRQPAAAGYPPYPYPYYPPGPYDSNALKAPPAGYPPVMDNAYPPSPWMDPYYYYSPSRYGVPPGMPPAYPPYMDRGAMPPSYDPYTGEGPRSLKRGVDSDESSAKRLRPM